MTGGTWTIQNKVLPGVYTNIIGEGPKPSVIGDRGVAALPVVLPWLEENAVMVLYPSDVAQFIADYGDYAVPVREATKKASQLYIYRLNKGEKATATLGNLICTAKYSGDFGNRLKVSVENVLGDSGKFYVITWLDTGEVDRQTVEDISGLKNNRWIDFSAAGNDKSLTINAGKPVEWEVRPISEDENIRIKESCTIRTVFKGRQSADFNGTRYTRMLCARSVASPDLKDAELQKSYGVTDEEDLLGVMLLPSEFTTLMQFVHSVNGFDLRDSIGGAP